VFLKHARVPPSSELVAPLPLRSTIGLRPTKAARGSGARELLSGARTAHLSDDGQHRGGGEEAAAGPKAAKDAPMDAPRAAAAARGQWPDSCPNGESHGRRRQLQRQQLSVSPPLVSAVELTERLSFSIFKCIMHTCTHAKIKQSRNTT
jgi:hypothetical protein